MQASTIARVVECEGVGLHGGAPVRVRLEPAESGGRIIVTASGKAFPATIDHVVASARATVLAAEPGSTERQSPGSSLGADSIATVEHLLAALFAREIDHVRIHVEGEELPAHDGSARTFDAALQSAGRRSVASGPSPIVLEEAVEIREGDRFARAEPYAGFGLSYAIDFSHPSVGQQAISIGSLDGAAFARELAAARTFGFLEEVEALRAAGLARGADLTNTVVLGDEGVVNPEPLRFPDEFVRHKALDLVGDLALLGRPLQAFVRIHKGGHRLHHLLVEAIRDRHARRARRQTIPQTPS